MTDRRSVGLVVDSGASLQEDIGGGLAVVRLHVLVGTQGLDDAADDDVYDRLRRGERATSSTPSPGEYLAAFEALAAEGFTDILCLTIPSRWSGMHGSAVVAAERFAADSPGTTVRVVETSTAAAGFALVARRVEACCRDGASLAEVLVASARACEDVGMFGALATLEFVARSGRVPALVAGVSDALRVRPVFEMRGGGTGRLGLARTDGGVLRVLERVARERFGPPTPVWLVVFHADSPALAEQLGDRVGTVCRVVRRETTPLSPVIGLHTGPGAVGFAALPAPA